MGTTSRNGSLDRRQFASDNYSGICPEALEAMLRANVGHAFPYGEDSWTARLRPVREMFETDCEVYFTLTGTAANSLRSRPCASPTRAYCARARPPGDGRVRGTGVFFQREQGAAGSRAGRQMDSTSWTGWFTAAATSTIPSRTWSASAGDRTGDGLHGRRGGSHGQRARSLGCGCTWTGTAGQCPGDVEGAPPQGDLGGRLDVLCLAAARTAWHGRGGGLLRQETGRGLRLPLQAVRATLSKMRFVAAQ